MLEVLNLLELKNKSLLFDSNENNSLMNLINNAGDKSNDFYSHAYISIQIRFAMMILPMINENHSYNQRYKIVENYLNAFNLNITTQIIEKILEVISNLNKYDKNTKKDGWSKLHYTEKNRLLVNQNLRCKVCGSKFIINEDRKNMNRPELDHIIPFALGGNNEENTRIICKQCNISKGTNLSFVNENIVSMNYFINKHYNKNKIIYWCFERDESRCTEKGCLNTSKNTKLYVKKIHQYGRFIYDNLKTVCEQCYNNNN